MEAVLRKYLWVLDVAVAAVCAVFLARATASLAESQMIRNMPPRAAGAPAFSSQPVVAYSKELNDILARNVFCSDCPPFEDVVEVPVDPVAAAEAAGEAEPERTAMPLAVMAIMYAPPPMGITYSVAVMKDTEHLTTGAFSVGDYIREAKIIGIDETRIHFDNKGKREFLDLLATEGPAPVPATVAAAAPAAPQDELSKELAQGLKKTGENTYELQRSTLDSVLGNMSLLSRSARIVPEVKDGKSAGFRLYAVRPEGPFALIGMQNGDVLYAINGLEMSSPEKALEVYSKLKSARHLSVSLERNGQKVQKEYTIR